MTDGGGGSVADRYGRAEGDPPPADDDGEGRPSRPEIECGYCGRRVRKIRLKRLTRTIFVQPAGWKKLPNKLWRCPDCDPDRDA